MVRHNALNLLDKKYGIINYWASLVRSSVCIGYTTNTRRPLNVGLMPHVYMLYTYPFKNKLIHIIIEISKER